MFVVVHGREWDDVAYFSDERSAYYSLFLHTLGAFRCASRTHWPELFAYSSDARGAMKQRWKASIDLEAIEDLLERRTIADVCDDVGLAIAVSTKTVFESI